MESTNEGLCKREFDGFLRKHYPARAIRWTEICQENEPPDYYLSLMDVSYAVEVTTLMETLQVGSLHLSQLGIVQSLRAFVNEIEEQARHEGALSGLYTVGFQRPIEDFRLAGDQIRDSLLDYIRNTRSMSSAPEHIVFSRRRRQQCWIQKFRDSPDAIGVDGWLVCPGADMNEYIRDRLKSIQKTLLAHYRGGKGLPNAVSGAEREDLINCYLSEVLPALYRFGRGAITDSKGGLCGQLEVIIEFPCGPNFPMPGEYGQQDR